MTILVDSHCHLNFDVLKEDIEGVISRAKDQGVRYMQTISTSIAEFDEVLSMANLDEAIWCSVGTHPNNTHEEPDINVEDIISRTSHAKVIGIGETGLDFHYETSPRELQIKQFGVHIQAAQQTGLPVIIHSRDADQETLDIIDTYQQKAPFKGLIHCFSTGRLLAEGAIKRGLYVSLSGILTFKNAKEIQHIVKDLPLDRLLVETDAPYLAPAPHRGKSNEPAYTYHTATYLAELKGISFEEVAQQTTKNFFTLFDKATPRQP